MLNARAIVEAWSSLPSEARVSPPKTEAEYEELVELMHHVTDELERRREAVEDSSLAPLFRLTAQHMLEWEREHEKDIPDVTPAERLALLMEEHKVSQNDLHREGIINQGNLSKILSGERKVSKALARALGERFKLDPGLFL